MTQQEEPTGYELQRNIDGLRKDMREGLADIKLIVAGLVSRDLFEAERMRRDEQIIQIRNEIAAMGNTSWKIWTQVFLPLACLGGTILINVAGR